jgi:hypothetical protein
VEARNQELTQRDLGFATLARRLDIYIRRYTSLYEVDEALELGTQRGTQLVPAPQTRSQQILSHLLLKELIYA